MQQADSTESANAGPPPLDRGDVAKMMEALLTMGGGRPLSTIGYSTNLDEATEMPAGAICYIAVTESNVAPAEGGRPCPIRAAR